MSPRVHVGDLVVVRPKTDADRATLDVIGRAGEVVALHRTRATVRLGCTHSGCLLDHADAVEIRIRLVDLQLGEATR